MDDETRVILIKPGDTLLIGNLGSQLTEQEIQVILDAFKSIGVDRVALFTEDIDISKLLRE